MRALGDFVDRIGDSLDSGERAGKPSRIGVIATAGDRRDEDMRELGEVAAEHFDVVIVREDVSLRRRKRGETATLVAEGVRRAMDKGVRCKQLEVILDEIEAVHHAMSRANRGRPARGVRRPAPAGDVGAGELVADGPAGCVARQRRHPGRRPGLHAAVGGRLTQLFLAAFLVVRLTVFLAGSSPEDRRPLRRTHSWPRPLAPVTVLVSTNGCALTRSLSLAKP